MRFFIVLFLAAYGCGLQAQSFLYLGREDPSSSPIDVVDFTPTNCSLIPNCTVANSEAAPFFFIAYSPTGMIYSLDNPGKKLFKYEEATCSFAYVDTILAPLAGDIFNYTSLTVDKEGMIYIGGRNVTRYNPFDGTQKKIFEFNTPVGDIPSLFFKGDTLMAISDYLNIYRVDTVNQTLDSVSKITQYTPYDLFDARQYYRHCDSLPVIYLNTHFLDWAVFDFVPTILEMSPTYEANITCTLQPSALYYTMGFTTLANTRNPCEVVVHLDSDSSSTGQQEHGFRYRVDCQDGAITAPVCDTDLRTDINILPFLDSLVVRFAGAVPDPGQESLELPGQPPPFVDVTNTSNVLVLHRLPGGSVADLETALRQVRYRHTGITATPGDRLIEVIPYRFHLYGQIATATISISPNRTSDTSIAIVVCPGETYTVGGSIYEQAGNYTDTLTNSIGCDSIIRTQLTFRPVNQRDTAVVRCPGASFQVGNNIYTATGIYADTLTGYFGCDSIVRTQLTIQPPNITTDTRVLCFGETWTAGGQTYTASGTYRDTLTSANGCDSIIITQLTVRPFITSLTEMGLCPGDSVLWNGTYYRASGQYTDTLSASNGCDSIATLVLSDLIPLRRDVDTVLCAGASLVIQGQVIDQPGTYVFLENNGECRDTLAYEVSLDQIAIAPIPDVRMAFGGNTAVELDIQHNGAPVAVSWLPPDGVDCPSCANVVLSPNANIQYEVTATTGFGCTTTQTIRVIVLERGAFFVPNVLSRSDADPRNRVFNFFSDDPGLLVECTIADRWGGLVMHENGLKPNFWAGWDGTWRGKHLSPGVYMYSLVLTKRDNPAFRENIIGTVTIAD